MFENYVKHIALSCIVSIALIQNIFFLEKIYTKYNKISFEESNRTDLYFRGFDFR
jgi:hypothetical protein